MNGGCSYLRGAGSSSGSHVKQAHKNTAIIANSLILQKRKTQGVWRGNIPGRVQGRGESGNVCEDVTFMAKPDD